MADHEHAADSASDEPRGPSDADPGLRGKQDRGATATAEKPEPAEPGPLSFRRDREHKMIAGVCAGLGRRCDMDPVIFRITLAVLSATGGIGLIFYGFAWLFVPYEDDDENEVRRLLTGRVDGQALAAVLFALVGCGIFLSMLRNGDVLMFAAVLSLLLAGAGYWSRNRDTSETAPLTAQAVADAPPEPKAPPMTATFPSWWRDPIVKDGTHVGGTGYLWGPGDSGAPDLGRFTTVDLSGHRHQHPRHQHPGHHRPHHFQAPRQPAARLPRWIGGWLFFLSLGAGALTTRLTWDDHPLGTSLQAGLSATLIVLGLGIAVSSFLGRTGAGSFFLALVTAGLLAATTTVPKNISTHWRDTTWKPTTSTQLLPSYELGTGKGTLDLTALDLTKTTGTTTDINVGVGQLRVIVPKGLTVRLSADVGLGDIRLPGENSKDVDVEPGRHKEVTLTPAAGTTPAGTLDLSVHVGVGQAEVTRAAS